MKPVSFFWYLYGGIILALVFTMTMLALAIYQTNASNSWRYFALDVENTLMWAHSNCQSVNLNTTCLRNVITSDNFALAHAISQPDAELVGTWNTELSPLKIYRYHEGFQAEVLNQPNLWIKDSVSHLVAYQQDNEVIEVLGGILAATFSFLVIMAAILIWPIRRLIRWLKHLDSATEALAKENYSIHIPSINIHPFYQLAKRFNYMTRTIESNVEEKRILANAMAHEMRTPLSRARLALALLQRKITGTDNLALAEDLERYINELEQVTQNSLQLVRLQNSELQLTEVNLSTFIAEKIALRNGTISALTWQTDLGEYCIESDEHFLSLILDNLLNNAEHYAKQEISVAIKQVSKGLQVSISDDGPGIPEEQHQQALQAYSRLDESRDRRSGGIGLGLALVNTACQRLNIRITLRDNNPGLRVELKISTS